MKCSFVVIHYCHLKKTFMGLHCWISKLQSLQLDLSIPATLRLALTIKMFSPGCLSILGLHWWNSHEGHNGSGGKSSRLVAGSIPLWEVSKCLWARHPTPNCSWRAWWCLAWQPIIICAWMGEWEAWFTLDKGAILMPAKKLSKIVRTVYFNAAWRSTSRFYICIVMGRLI